jgi:hypothetical protein
MRGFVASGVLQPQAREGNPEPGWVLPWPLRVRYAEVRLLSSDVFTVEGTLDEVEKRLSDAARSGQARLAWFKEHGTDSSVGINPAHVAALRASEASD